MSGKGAYTGDALATVKIDGKEPEYVAMVNGQLYTDMGFAESEAKGSTVEVPAVNVNGKYYTTLEAALKAVYVGGPYETPVDIICKEGANLGKMAPHTHIADSINIIGNGATVKGDLEIDTYKYARGKYAQDANGDYLTKDITVNVEGLNGIAAMGRETYRQGCYSQLQELRQYGRGLLHRQARGKRHH